MSLAKIKIFDETLRDGEQQARVFFPYDIKLSIARAIAASGIHYIDIMPIIDDSEERLVRSLVTDGLDNIITPATMLGKRFIDLSRACGVKRIILFSSVSDRLMFLRDSYVQGDHITAPSTIDHPVPAGIIDGVRQRALRMIVEGVRYAVEDAGLDVDFAAEDATRADFDFLVECINKTGPYLDHFVICDTVGILTPDESYRTIKKILDHTGHTPLGVHFHNDLGLALENTIQAVLSGASLISGTLTGIGERAGNVCIDSVLFGLKRRFDIEVEGIDYDRIEDLALRVEGLGVRPARPYSRAALYTETGIHVNAFLKDPKSYCLFGTEPEIWFGKCSGASNFQYVFEKLIGNPLPRSRYEQMRKEIKKMSIKEQRSFSTQEIIQLYEEGKI